MSNFKVGDFVKVARKVTEGPGGFDARGRMEKLVGKEFQVEEYEFRDGWNIYYLKNSGGWLFPEESLVLAGPYAKYHAIAREICHGEVQSR